MKCHHHPETDAVQECRLCGHPLCAECSVLVKGAPYCRTCLAEKVEAAPAAELPAPLPDYRSPKAAGWLSLMPGLGLLYLGQYLKALAVALAVVGTWQLADRHDVAGFVGFLLWIGQIIYTVQEAKRLNRIRAGQTAVQPPAAAEDRDSPLWGGLLVGLGVLFLLDQFDLIHFTEIFERFWPLLIIGLGLQILFRARKKGSDPLQS